MTAVGTAGLGARALALAGAVDLLDYYEPRAGFFFERGGDGVVGVGDALRLTVPPGPDQVARAAAEAGRALAGIAAADGGTPVIVGALPFAGSRPATLVVPRIAVVVRRGRARMIVTGREDMPEPETHPHEVPATPRALAVRAEPEPPDYVEAVREAVARIRAGALRKVVLARALVATSDHVLDAATLLERLRAVERGSFAFGVEEMIGASPELLVARRGTEVVAEPLAGTARRAADPASDADAARALLGSAKDREEHALVVEAVRAALEPACERIEVDAEPAAMHTSSLWHLATTVRGRLREPAPSALALAAALHPTPAVCGTPTGAARAAIGDLERIDRGLYAGAVGWMDARGDGEWAVALRCAEVRGRSARLYAGAGIVADSDPEAELAETEAKFAALLDALGYA